MIAGLSQKFANIISVIRKQFRDIFDRVKGVNDYTLDQMCSIVSVDIFSRLGMEVIGKNTIKGFYYGENINSKNLEKISAWIDYTYLHRYWVVGKKLPIYGLGLGRHLCFIPPLKQPATLLFLLSFLLSRPALSCVLLCNKECFDWFLKCVRFVNVNINHLSLVPYTFGTKEDKPTVLWNIFRD